MEIPAVAAQVSAIRTEAAQLGRFHHSIKFIAGILVIADETDELARAKYEEYLSYADLESLLALSGGWTGTDLGTHAYDEDFKFSDNGGIRSIISSWSATMPGGDSIRSTKKRVATELALGGPHAKAIGSAKTVADILQRWVEEAGVDGLNLSYAVNPGDFEAIVKWLIPELKSRGVFWDPVAAEGKTMRENYLADGRGPRLSDDHPGSKDKWDTVDGPPL